MILVYGFCALKATHLNRYAIESKESKSVSGSNSPRKDEEKSMRRMSVTDSELDMFATLKDVEKGFGIVNKTSIRIYNDPFRFFAFVKLCLSGLIDAGRLKENERLGNQVNFENILLIKSAFYPCPHIFTGTF